MPPARLVLEVGLGFSQARAAPFKEISEEAELQRSSGFCELGD